MDVMATKTEMGTCPVCYLELRPDIPLNVHLDTHPKEMIVHALMACMQPGVVSGGQQSPAVAAAAAPPPPSSSVVPSFVRTTMSNSSSSNNSSSNTATTSTLLQRNVQQVIDLCSGRSIVRGQQFQVQQQQQQQENDQFLQPGSYQIYTRQPTQHHQQQPMSVVETTSGNHHYIEARYVQDELGNIVLCTSEEALPMPTSPNVTTRKENYSSSCSSSSSVDNTSSLVDNMTVSAVEYQQQQQFPQQQMNTNTTNPPEYATAIQDKQKQQLLMKQKLQSVAPSFTGTKEPPKILSVLSFGPSPKDNSSINWNRVVEEREVNRLSPNAVLPAPMKRHAMVHNVTPTPGSSKTLMVDPQSQSQHHQQQEPQRVTILAATPPPASPLPVVIVRPVATSVIRTTAVQECVKVDLNVVEGAGVSEKVTAIVQQNESSESSARIGDPVEETDPQPSTSGGGGGSAVTAGDLTLTMSRGSKRDLRLNKPPKVLKVTFKKPIHTVESTVVGGGGGDDDDQPSTSKQSESNKSSKMDSSSSSSNNNNCHKTSSNITTISISGESATVQERPIESALPSISAAVVVATATTSLSSSFASCSSSSSTSSTSSSSLQSSPSSSKNHSFELMNISSAPPAKRGEENNTNDCNINKSTTTDNINNNINWTDGRKEEEVVEEAAGQSSCAAEVVAPGMLQLKAEACEEVFISQHSLIKMEAEDEENEVGIGGGYGGYGRATILTAKSEMSMHEEEAGPSMKMYMDLKSEHDPSIIEELCLSESSVCSMVNEVMERMDVNIRAEEVMPAKGEISEQESNADSEWPSNAIETFETSRILPSYDTSVARESWNFGHANSSDNLTFNGIQKLSSIIGIDDGHTIKTESFQCDDEAVAGPSDSSFSNQSSSTTATTSKASSSSVRRSKPYNCPGCPETFRLFRQRKDHIIAHHEELLSKKQRYNYLRQIDKLEVERSFTMLAGPGAAAACGDTSSEGGANTAGGTGSGGGGYAPHFGPAAMFTRRIEQLSVIKLHRFLIEFNLKALKETVYGQLHEYQGLLMDFSQRRVYFCTECRQQFTTMREYRKHMSVHPVRCHTCEVEVQKSKEGEKDNERERTGEGSQMKLLLQSSPGAVKQERRDDDEEEVDGDDQLEAAVVKIEQLAGCSKVEAKTLEQPTQLETAAAEPETTFWNWRRFVEHQKTHLGLTEVNMCKQCGKSFGSRRKLSLHMSTHSRKTYHCTFCPRTFMHLFRLKEHKKRHHFGVNNNKKGLSGRGDLRMGGVNAVRQKDYLCPCGEVFHSAAKFTWHLETHDKNPKGCPYCRERFVHKNSLSRHIRLAHQDKYSEYKKDTLPCPVCHNRYIRTSLKTHLASHMKRPEFQCSICNKILSTKWNLKIHRWTHNSRTHMPFKCSLCPKAFMRSSDLHTHVNTHKSIRPFTCDHCGCQFSRKYNWVRHTREHETEKRFRCVHCGKTFHRAYYLKEHSRSHTNERPFECTICGKTSTTKTNHNKHLKIHHARDVAATEG